MEVAGELQRQVEAHKARLARFARQAEKYQASRIVQAMPCQMLSEPEKVTEAKPVQKKRPSRDYWTCRPKDRRDPKYPEIARIQRLVARHFVVDVCDMIKPSKFRGSEQVCTARYAAIYFCRNLTGKSLPFLGRCFGRRDHTTIIHSIRRCEELIANDPYAAADISALKQSLGG